MANYTEMTRAELRAAYQTMFGVLPDPTSTTTAAYRQALQSGTPINGTTYDASILSVNELSSSDDAPTPKPAKAKSKLATAPNDDPLTAMLIERILPYLGADIRDAIRAELQAEFSEALNNRPRELEITIKTAEDFTVVNVGNVHKTWPLLLTASRLVVRGNRQPVYLHGPAGSGKSTAAYQVAEALGLRYRMIQFGPASQIHEIMGYKDANGNYHSTPFRETWEHGGVILLDEYDASGEVMVAMNGALANGLCVFPDSPEPVKRHADCIIIAAGNTVAKGPSDEYTARQRLDQATIDRFAFLAWGYDEAMELQAAGTDQAAWVKHVQKIRKAIQTLGPSAPDVLVTPRASIAGAAMLRENPDTPYTLIEDLFVWQGCDDDGKTKVRHALKGY